MASLGVNVPRLAWFTVILSTAMPLLLAGQQPTPTTKPPRPIQVTDSAIARGEELFHGIAACATCHGPAGVGTDSGPALAQGVWMHGPDTFEGILSRVLHGVPKAYSTRDIAMPMRGWSEMSDRQARDVAAYVWRISHDFPAARRP